MYLRVLRRYFEHAERAPTRRGSTCKNARRRNATPKPTPPSTQQPSPRLRILPKLPTLRGIRGRNLQPHPPPQRRPRQDVPPPLRHNQHSHRMNFRFQIRHRPSRRMPPHIHVITAPPLRQRPARLHLHPLKSLSVVHRKVISRVVSIRLRHNQPHPHRPPHKRNLRQLPSMLRIPLHKSPHSQMSSENSKGAGPKRACASEIIRKSTLKFRIALSTPKIDK